jgi:E3 SUMO-protein ligase RanBP2
LQEKPKGDAVKKDLSLMDQFKPKTGSWECPGCMCRNDADKIQCPACQTAQPGHEDEVKQMNTSGGASAFTFNSGPAVSGGGFNLAPASSTTPSTQSGFKFGVSTATASPATSASSDFKFGAGPTSAAPATGFSFVKQDATSTTGFSFGKKVEPTPSAGGAAEKPATSGFSFTKPVLPVPSTPVEKSAEPVKPSPFAGFSFGLKTEEVKKAEPEKKSSAAGVDLSESKNLASFADLATTTGFGFGTSKSNFSFSGAGAPVFGQSRKEITTSATAANEDDDDGQVEGADHDPHFEPIIPLPELVQVTTGEEDEEELFGQKAKCYRYVNFFIYF